MQLRNKSTRTATKLETLLDAFGFATIDELAEYSMFGSGPGAPAICTNAHCDYTTEYESDCVHGWCEVCRTNTVASGLVIAGIS